jgi:hypothetical protein
MSDHRALLLLATLLWLPACAKPAVPPPAESGPAPAAIETENVPPPPEIAPGDIEDAPLAPEETRAPGSLSCLASGSIEEEFRVPVTATFDPNSDFARLSLDTVGESTFRCSLVITRWSTLPESGPYEQVFTRAQLAEGAEEAEAFFVVESGEKRWVADDLNLRMLIGTDSVSGEFSGNLVETSGSLLQISNGLFTAPLRRLASLPADPEAPTSDSVPADPPS